MDNQEEPRTEEDHDIKETARKLKEMLKDFARQGARLTKEKCRRVAASDKLKPASCNKRWCLFDLSLSGSAALSTIRIAYVLSLIMSALVSWRLIRLGLHVRGAGTVVFGILLFFFLAFSARAIMEVAAAILRMAEDTVDLAESMGEKDESSPSASDDA